MNIYDCRFVDPNDEVFHVRQYGTSESEIEKFWKEWYPMHYPNTYDRVFIDCILAEENVSYDEERERDSVCKALKAREG